MMQRLVLMLLIAAGLVACTVIFGDGSVSNHVNRELDVKVESKKK